jgi:hypothetical protein
VQIRSGWGDKTTETGATLTNSWGRRLSVRLANVMLVTTRKGANCAARSLPVISNVRACYLESVAQNTWGDVDTPSSFQVVGNRTTCNMGPHNGGASFNVEIFRAQRELYWDKVHS